MTREPDEGEQTVAETAEQPEGLSQPIEEVARAEGRNAVDLSEMDKPTRRFYANLSDL